MKRIFSFLILFLFSLGFAQDFVSDSSSANNYEHILSFHSDIEIDKNAEVTITEKIKVYASGNNIKRGIFRSLPLWRNVNGKKTRIKYDILSTKKNGEKEKYHTESGSSDLTIYFGDKEVILTPGIYDYELKYTTNNQIGFFDNYDEFYWNVNGNLWDFKVDEISAKLTLPNNATIVQNSCYTGAYRSNSSNCKSEKTASNIMVWSARDLQENEGLSIAAGFNKGVFAPPPPPGFLEKYGVLGAVILAILGLLSYFFTSWQKYGIDPQKPVAYPQFNSPQNLSPASLGYLESGYYSAQMISAAIVNLAIKGFIKIVEDDKRVLGIFGGKEFTLEKTKEPDQTLPKEEINLMNKLFASGENSITIDGKYNSSIENAVNDFKASLSYQHDKFLATGNNSSKLILPSLVILFLYGIGMFFSFKSSYNELYLGLGIAALVVTLIVGIFISYFYERYFAVKILFAIISLAMVIVLFTVVSTDGNRIENIGFYASYALLIFGFIGMVLFQFFIKQPTPEKLETLSLIEGFKMYLGTAEEKTLQFHNPPQLTPEIFEKMLPFAMVLGVDKIWGDKFQNLLKTSSLGAENYQSNWFVGASIMNMNFTNSLNSSLSQSIASSSTQPSSSGSGSGGGGFSGGGGGGGGGGGW